MTEVIILFKVQNTSNSTNIKYAYSRVNIRLKCHVYGAIALLKLS